MTREEKIMEGVRAWTAFYRENPNRFAEDFLHLKLKKFQEILIVEMNRSTNTVFIGARGIGKSFISAVFIITRMVLYPGSKICIASGTRSQALNIMDKILLELKPNSPELAHEIDDRMTKQNGTEAILTLKNGSYCKVITSGESSRGNRANILLLDEFRLVNYNVFDQILRKFLTQQRMPKYSELSEEEKKIEYDKESNMTLFLSSAWYVNSWCYSKSVDTYKAMLDDRQKQFYCAYPYQLSLSEGLLKRETIEDEMYESNFNEVTFSIEYEGRFYGNVDGAFFDFPSISKNRHIQYPMLPGHLAEKLGNNPKVKIPPKQNGEKRILSADIALMSSKKNKNDATAVFINQLLPTKAGRYSENIVYCDAFEGLHTEDQALVIRKLYDEFDCDYIVLDCAGVGIGVFDALARDLVDPDTGEIYPPLTSCNDNTMAERCSDKQAPKVIWTIKANASLNSDCAVLLREGFKSGKIRLLVSEFEAEELLSEIKGFKSLSPAEKMQLQMPYVHTTLLIDELVKLRHDESNGKVKIYERSGERKDRYSSLSYNHYVSTILESRINRKRHTDDGTEDWFMYRAPSSTKITQKGW